MWACARKTIYSYRKTFATEYWACIHVIYQWLCISYIVTLLLPTSILHERLQQPTYYTNYPYNLGWTTILHINVHLISTYFHPWKKYILSKKDRQKLILNENKFIWSLRVYDFKISRQKLNVLRFPVKLSMVDHPLKIEK